MDARTRVVVWGTTICMAAIAASLCAHPCLQVISLDPRDPGAADALAALEPAATLFDRSNPPPDVAPAMLGRHPGAMLIGVDPSSDSTIVFSWREERLVSAAELIQVILLDGPPALGIAAPDP